MNVVKLQNNLFRTNKVQYISKFINFGYLNISLWDNHRTLCINVAHLISCNQQISLSNVITKQYKLRVQNNFSRVTHPSIVSHAILHNNKGKHVPFKSYTQQYNSVRHFSSAGTDLSVETKVPFQYNGIFKVISESTPIKATQDSLLWIHDYTGLPWWSVIILTTVIMRTIITVPLTLYQQYIFAKLENLKYEMDEIVKELKMETNYGMHKYNWPEKYARHLYNHSVKKHWNKLIVRENCHPLKGGLLILAQIPLWISLSMSIRNLCYMLPKQDANAYATYKEFANDGFLWITNLTVADPFVLPVTMGLCNLAIIEITHLSRVKEVTRFTKYLTYFFRIFAIGMIPVAMYVPSCLSLYWVTSSAYGLFQNLVLLSPKLRRFAGIPITNSESPRPYSLLRERIIAKYSYKKKVVIRPKT